MCIDVTLVGNRKPYGFLFKNDLNQFVYSCSQCDKEFSAGNELEQHSIGHDVKKECDSLPNHDSTIDIEPIEVYPPSFSSSENLKDESTVPTDSTKEEMAIYLPFESQKLEVTMDEKEDTPADDATTEPPIGDDFSSFDFQNDAASSSSSSSDDDYFTPTTKKKSTTTTKKSTTTTKKSTKTPKKEAKNNKYTCEICSRMFTSLARIKQHIYAGHIKKKKPAKRPPSPTLCTLCGKQIRDMKTHLKTFHSTERPFKCDFCDATFKQKVHRDTHVRQHTGEKPYICHHCGRSYHSQSVLNAHVNRYHLHKKPHKCDQCGKEYRQLYELRDHVNLHHLNQKMHPCEVCDRRFGTRKHLHQHMLSHGEKRFQCKFCDQKFATTSGRRGHELRNHQII